MTPQQFEARVEKIPFSGCWIWMKGLRGGYGSVAYGGSTQFAHRVAWWLFRGYIPDGKLILHKCDIKCCVNPDHLYCGTNAENSDDYWRRIGKHYNTEKTMCKYGHKLIGHNLMIDNRGDRLCRECNRLRSAAWRRGVTYG